MISGKTQLTISGAYLIALPVMLAVFGYTPSI